jgi:glycerol-3-phosphate acyltransferase PlsY
MTAIWIGLVLGAALSSVPFAWLVHRLATGRDLRDEGSGNPGSTNVYRVIGPAWGALALALDAGKGALAVWMAGRLAGAAGGLGAAIGAVLGHVYTPWLSGRGGKGVAPAAGAFLVLAPGATAAASAVFGTVLALTRFVSLGSVLAAVALPFAILALGPGHAAAAAAAVVAVAIAWRHRENFARMRAGTEPRARWSASPRRSERR